MRVKELIEDLKNLPPDDTLIIEYWHENEPDQKTYCDVHDTPYGTGTLKGISWLQIVGREAYEDE